MVELTWVSMDKLKRTDIAFLMIILICMSNQYIYELKKNEYWLGNDKTRWNL